MSLDFRFTNQISTAVERTTVRRVDHRQKAISNNPAEVAGSWVARRLSDRTAIDRTATDRRDL